MLLTLAEHSDQAQLTDPLDDLDTKATAYALFYLSGGMPQEEDTNGRPTKPRLPTVTNLAQYLNVSRPLLANWLTNEGTEQGVARATAYRTRVKQQAAATLVDGALEVIEGAQAHEASLAKARAGVRQWIAERLDRSSWGQQQPQGTVIGALHLHASLPLSPTLPGGAVRGLGGLPVESPPLVGSPDSGGVVGYLSPSKDSPSTGAVNGSVVELTPDSPEPRQDGMDSGASGKA